ncbi:FdhF/YdeP family oxidoreductase [Rhizobium glycinendophyticum]|uniref:FdhF/YdeP family oxidoreductase n=1 Tax=Rhizobium glycinendophyticum TaxID=2589807 RepID=A0A504TT11_9HYPH|nr:FdhF/YdeP family oxidoreductase [Rhizobium glycinendophyticum]TPP04647.1 FdhF/YdeP family oxidoreductase [Rhizobium glycinendophyticum]
MAKDDTTIKYDGPAGGWGSLRGIARIAGQEGITPGAIATLLEQNKPGGFACVSCAWTKPAEHHPVEFCENGAKATLWELTGRKAGREVFARHSVTELRSFSDYQLEQLGRLTQPMRYHRASDRYVPCSWDEAFGEIGRELRKMDPKKTVFYTSGRASLETAYLWALFARAYGHNNLPDSSNMCHETTSVTLKKVIGSPVGTIVLDDFKHCDAIFFFGQNTGSNSPRFLHVLQAAVRRGCRIVTFNPVRERGLESMINPQEPTAMVSGHETALSCQYHQVKPGGDIAVLLGLCKHVLAADDVARTDGRSVVDRAFIAEHTTGFAEFEVHVRGLDWAEIETVSGLSRAAIEAAGSVYVEANSTIGIYGMGLTQHVHGFENIATYMNLLLMKGNIGRKGAGMSPVRGHSNVQGQRTVGIAEKPELVPLDRLAELYEFEPPRDKGMNTVETCEAILKGDVGAFIGLGGNFLRAIPEQKAMEEAWPRMRMTVQIATKLNRSHLVNGEIAYLLPCLGRSEMDTLTAKPQVVSMEDSLSCVHGSVGKRKPASRQLKSELEIVSRIAQATLPANPKMAWGAWARDTALVRNLIERTYPDQFRDFNARIFTPGGFYRGNAARERQWKTQSGKAEFVTPKMLSATGFESAPGRVSLITMRSNDQFNTTIYGYSDRLRGIEGKRNILLISPREIERHGLTVGETVTLVSDAGDGIDRRVSGLEVLPFDLPDDCVGGYYPELNPLVPLSHHDRQSKTPAYKSVPVRIERQS